ncbi:hypothetical protein DN073_31715 [Pseudomonas aeruginosa]|nr:hypothetical protein DN073_31715 [Pseudomonas aeruginosa]
MTAAVMTTALPMMTPTHQQPFEEPHGATLSSGLTASSEKAVATTGSMARKHRETQVRFTTAATRS